MTLQEKIEAKTEQMKEKNKNKKKATRKQKVVASIIIPVSAVLVAVAIASPNNNHRETTPPPPADTSHHASTEKKGDVKFNGDSPSVEKAVDQIFVIAKNKDLGKSEKIDKVEQLAKGVTVSSELLDLYMGGIAVNFRDGRIGNDYEEDSRLLQIFKAKVVSEKMKGSFNADFADDYAQVVKEYYRGTAEQNTQFVDQNLYQMEKNFPNLEY